MRKTHFSVDPANSTQVACGREVNDHGQTPFTERVTCGTCKQRTSFKRQKVKDDKAKHERFLAQSPREVAEPWREGNVHCTNCGNMLFRIGDRTCYGHYENYHCSSCGHVESRLTETGMSF